MTVVDYDFNFDSLGGRKNEMGEDGRLTVESNYILLLTGP